MSGAATRLLVDRQVKNVVERVQEANVFAVCLCVWMFFNQYAICRVEAMRKRVLWMLRPIKPQSHLIKVTHGNFSYLSFSHFTKRAD